MLPGLSDRVNAQTTHTLTNAPLFKITNYEVLPDNHYTLDRVTADQSLGFKADSLKPPLPGYYWIKLNITNPYPNNEPYLLSLDQPFNYKLYYYNGSTHKWINVSAGFNAVNGLREPGLAPLVLPQQSLNAFYLKIDLRDVQNFKYALKPVIILEKQVIYQSTELFVNLTTLFCCIVLISFVIYNLYIYFNLKDRAYLYYIVVQIAAIFYLLSVKRYFNIICPLRIYHIELQAGKRLLYMDLNDIIMHTAVISIFWGLTQFTRSYLRTKELMPAYDKLLKLLAIGYNIMIITAVTLSITGLYFVNIIPAANGYLLVMIGTYFITALVAYQQKIRAAKYFLAANLLPLLFTAATSVGILFFNLRQPFLPEIAILSQIFTFAVALVARVKLINDDLKAKEIKSIQLEADVKVVEYKRLLIEEENKYISLTMALEKEKNDLLQERLDANQRELVGNSLYIHQKNKLLADLSDQISDMETLFPNVAPEAMVNIRSSLKGGTYLDDEWDKFKLHFEQVHPSFFNDLQAKHPLLTKYELRLYAYFHIKLSTKEIAALLNIAPASVRQAKARLNKKMTTKT